MSEESNQEDGGAQGNAAKTDGQGTLNRGVPNFKYLKPAAKSLPESLIRILKAIFDNLSTVLPLMYIYVTAIGLFTSWALYRNFGINIFDYSEVGDFFLAAFKTPGAILLAGEQLLLLLLGGLLTDNWAKIQSGKVPSRETGYERPTILLASLAPFVLVFTAVVFSLIGANDAANSIKHGEQPAVDVRYRSFSGTAGQVTEPNLSLIGSTQKAAFFYDVDDERTIVIPQAQIVSIEVPE